MKFRKIDILKNMKVIMTFTDDTMYNESLFYTIKSITNKRKITNVIYISNVIDLRRRQLNDRIVKSFLLFDTFVLKKPSRKILNEIREKYVFDVAEIMEKFLVNEVSLKVWGL